MFCSSRRWTEEYMLPVVVNFWSIKWIWYHLSRIVMKWKLVCHCNCLYLLLSYHRCLCVCSSPWLSRSRWYCRRLRSILMLSLSHWLLGKLIQNWTACLLYEGFYVHGVNFDYLRNVVSMYVLWPCYVYFQTGTAMYSVQTWFLIHIFIGQ